MYPLVGAINHRNRFTLDLGFGTIRLAVVTDQDLTKAQDHRKLRGQIAEALNQDGALKQELLGIRARLGEVSSSFRGSKPMIAVVEEGKVVQAVYDSPTFSNKVGAVRERLLLKPNGKVTASSAADFRLLPALYVDGPNIKRKDTAEVVQLKGVDIPSRLDSPWAQDNRYSLGLLAIAKEWGANHVKVLFRARRVQPYLQDTKRLVEEAEKRGIYVIVTGSGVGTEGGICRCGYNDIPLPNDEVIEALVNLASELKPYNNVILDVWNEPEGDWGDINTLDGFEKKTYDMYVKAIKAVRETNDRVIIVVSGVFWGRDVTYLNLLPPLPDSNLLYRVQHNPPALSDADTTIPDWEFGALLERWSFLIGVHPVMIGEWGGWLEKIQGTPDQMRWYERTLSELVNKYKLHYSQYVLGGYDAADPYHLDLAVRSAISCENEACLFTYKRTPRGEAVFSDLRKSPPTQFDQ